MNFKDIELFLALFEEQNITKTADRLFLSQPALTKRIKKVEAYLGKPLLIRHHDGITFTPAGEIFLIHCRKIMDAYNDMLNQMNSEENDLQGTVRLGTTPIFAHYKLPSLLEKFKEAYPKVDFFIQTDLSRKIYRQLQEKNLSVAILREGHAWEAEKKLLFSEPICLAYHQEISFDELKHKNYIHYQTDSHLSYQIEHWWDERFSERPHISFSTSNVDAALELVKQGLGWSILPKTGLKNFDGYLEELHWLNQQPFSRSTWLCYTKESFNSAATSSFIEFVQNYDFSI
ncbi:LysR family transcriptional regulator [Enterococcus sp. 669A]|uniref:LysR family transcriptional regulator n=1 Tax=Candidatus Enterococcus moelleringii TaxID=2815325 RepID=A0ABS3L8U2_9ENTE|nr:LysR family transcriptional regulator [Enterococcus sp. 669A]MBO1306037.1 LysR family transcriptional regulator [Enterococcus sp. 669A]